MKKSFLVICGIILFSFSVAVFAGFQGVRTTLFFQNKNTHEVRRMDVGNFEVKSLGKIALMKYLNKSKIGDKSIFKDWYLSKICEGSGCVLQGEAQAGGYIFQAGPALDKDIESFDDKKEWKEFSIDMLQHDEKWKVLVSQMGWSIVVDYLLFIPLNLLIFYCFGYLFYAVLYKKLGLKFFKYIPVTSGLFYTLSFVLLYVYDAGFLNYSSQLFGFSGYLIFVGFWKFVLYVFSRYAISHRERSEGIVSHFESHMWLGNLVFLALLLVLSLFTAWMTKMFHF